MQAETVAHNPFAVAAIQADAGILPVGVPRYCRGMEPVAVYSCEIGRHQRDTVCALSVKVIVCYAVLHAAISRDKNAYLVGLRLISTVTGIPKGESRPAQS